MKKWLLFTFFCMGIMLGGCRDSRGPLRPDAPVSITVWHSYRGSAKRAFDELVQWFNETEGIERGIVVNALGQGDTAQLAETVLESADEKIGSAPLPHLFLSTPCSAYHIAQQTTLVELGRFFSEAEQEAFYQPFLEACYFEDDNEHLWTLPVSASFYMFFLNETDWKAFADATGQQYDNLSTWEGIHRVAEEYQAWLSTDAAYINLAPYFFGVDSLGTCVTGYAQQLGLPLLGAYAAQPMAPEVAEKIYWELYRPYAEGLYRKVNRYCHDDVRIAVSLSYVGSAAYAGFFPKEVTVSVTNTHLISCKVLPYPVLEGKTPSAPLDLNTICMTPSDEAHEYAGACFIKWLYELMPAQSFAADSGMLPVQTAALNRTELKNAQTKGNSTILQCLEVSMDMLESRELAYMPAKRGMYTYGTLLDDSLNGQVEREWADDASLQEKETVQQYFDAWYQHFTAQVAEALKNR